MGNALRKLFRIGGSESGNTTNSTRPKNYAPSPQNSSADQAPPVPWRPPELSFIALYPFQGRNEGDLSFDKGEVLKVFDQSGDWWVASSTRTQQQGYIPCNYVAPVNSLEVEDWFFGSCTRSEAIMRLQAGNLPKGTFLVRESETRPETSAFSVMSAEAGPSHLPSPSSPSHEISDKTLLALTKEITSDKYFEIGRELGSDSEAIHTLKRVPESVQAASKPMENVTDDADIRWDFITHTPPELKLQNDETVISCGIKFFPSGAKFTKAIKVTLDHNVQFINPRRAEIVFYTRHKDIKSFVRIPASIEGYPCCDIRTKDLDLFVDHFSEWWIVTKIKKLLGKRFNCTPYLEGLQPLCEGRTNTFRLYISDDLNDVNKKLSGTVGLKHKELAPSKPLFLKWRSGDVVISLMQEEEKVEVEVDNGNKRIEEEELFRSSPACNYQWFRVKSPDSEAQLQQFFNFILHQASKPKKKTSIGFTLNYETSESSGMSAEAGPSHLPSPSSSSQCSEKVTDSMLLNLAKYFPYKNYDKLCLALGESTNEADNRLKKLQNDSTKAVTEALNDWKNKRERYKNELIEVLTKSDAGGLVKILE